MVSLFSNRSQQLAYCLSHHALEGQSVAGTDEAGRGPLAGPVVAAAVILDPLNPIAGLNDSKKLSKKRRESYFDIIVNRALGYSIASASVEEIDRLNILHASMLAMKRAVDGLASRPDFVYVDGNRCPDWAYRSAAVVQGDGLIMSIAAASILAKVSRDKEMEALSELFPCYGFAIHKGYPTKAHLEALMQHGPCSQHRLSFKPVAELLGASLNNAGE